MHERLFHALREALPVAVALRRDLHRYPELSGVESGTCQRVLDALPRHAITARAAETGAVARVGGEGPAIGLRAELDALPVDERTDLSFRSQTPGVMHACGHDVHLAALVAVINAIDKTPCATPALAVLQPREETYPSGAKDITNSAMLSQHATVAMIGAHLHPAIARGSVACTTGPVNASSDEFTLTVVGADGHAAYPHLGGDAVMTLSQIVVAAQALISRMTDPMANAVVSFTTLRAGNAANAIPATATARGSIRAMDRKDRYRIIEGLTILAAHLASSYECRTQFEVVSGEPVLSNDPPTSDRCRKLLTANGFAIASDHRSAGSDDFAYYGELMPAVMMFVGTGSPHTPLHSATFAPPDSAVSDVAHALMCGYLAAERNPQDHDAPRRQLNDDHSERGIHDRQ